MRYCWSIIAVLYLVLGGRGIVISGTKSSHRESTTSPVIAIFVLPAEGSEVLPGCGTECEFVAAAFIKWLAIAGARSYPISYEASPAQVRGVLDSVNGLLFSGGVIDQSPGTRSALEYAIKLNRRGDYFPVWGACLGLEWISQALAGNKRVVFGGFDSNNMTQPLGLVSGAESSRMLSGFPRELLDRAGMEPVTTHNHDHGVSPDAVSESGLNETLRVLTINHDRAGKAFVGLAEGVDLPIYGVQWHPEKVMFQWALDTDGTPVWLINHGEVARRLSQHLADFFVSEARRNRHVISNPGKWEPCMFHNLQTTPTRPLCDQTYQFFPKQDVANLSCASFTNRTRRSRPRGAFDLPI